MFTYIHIYIYTHIYIYSDINIHIVSFVYMHVCISSRSEICTYIHIYMHTYIYIHTYTANKAFYNRHHQQSRREDTGSGARADSSMSIHAHRQSAVEMARQRSTSPPGKSGNFDFVLHGGALETAQDRPASAFALGVMWRICVCAT